MISFENTKSNHTFFGKELNEREMKAVNFAVAFSLILAMAQFMFISLASTYVEEKQKKLEYLTQNKITFESKLVNDILSMLVPKFVKNSMIKGKNFN